jgi:hypothetical protein
MSLRLLLAAVVALFALAPVPASAAERSFQTPSGRIGCLMTSHFVRCDPLFLNDRALELGRHGRGRLVRISDTVFDPGAPVLRYGRRARLGVFSCTSRRTGLTCRTRRGHGFSVSRERQRVF